MDGEPVDLLHEYGKRAIEQWRTGWAQSWNTCAVTLGQLPDGRWWVELTRAGATAYHTEEAARQALGRVLSSGEWREEPAEWTNRGVPADPAWRKVGTRWVRE